MSMLIRNANNIGGRLFGRGYYRAAIRAKLLLSGGREPVLIWQMGKVGSSSIFDSLHQARFDGAVFHVHVLSDTLIGRGELFKKSLRDGTVDYLYNVALRELLCGGNRRWKIISLVREPVGRNISAFFQNLDIYAPGMALDDASQVQMLRNTFFREFDHDRPLTWFDHEIKGLLGIDVFAQPFPKEQGYAEYTTDKCDMLVLRMEDLNAVGAQALGQFLGMPGIELAKANIGAEKAYADVYAQVRRQIGIPDEYLERMYASKYARHFYTDEEIEQFRARWLKAAS